jgi:hypothetical protein
VAYLTGWHRSLWSDPQWQHFVLTSWGCWSCCFKNKLLLSIFLLILAHTKAYGRASPWVSCGTLHNEKEPWVEAPYPNYVHLAKRHTIISSLLQQSETKCYLIMTLKLSLQLLICHRGLQRPIIILSKWLYCQIKASYTVKLTVSNENQYRYCRNPTSKQTTAKEIWWIWGLLSFS